MRLIFCVGLAWSRVGPVHEVIAMDMMTRRRAMMASGPHSPTIDDYVKSGIVFWLDGIENTRNGHDAASSKWYDLSSSQRNVTYNSGSVIGADCCIPNGSMSVTRDSGISTSYTIEVVVELISTGGPQMIMPWKGNNYGTVWIGTSGVFYCSAGGSGGAKGVTMPAGINTYAARGKANISINGVATTIINNNSTWSNTANCIGYYTSAYPDICRSKLYAIRIYNRLLTDAEVAQNAAIDAARFGRTS